MNILREQYCKVGFTKLNDEVFEALCIARIVEPTSKLDSLRVLADLGVSPVNQDKLYRSLAKAADQDYRKAISQACFEHVRGDSLTLILYDVTTLYFEIQEEDDYRKPGRSKERRLEPRSSLPVIEAFQAQHGLPKITIVADAAMLSATNLAALTEAGYTYIVGSRLHKVPYEIAEYQKTGEMSDQQIMVTRQEGYRVIYQYRAKRAALDLRNVERQVTRRRKCSVDISRQ